MNIKIIVNSAFDIKVGYIEANNIGITPLKPMEMKSVLQIKITPCG